MKTFQKTLLSAGDMSQATLSSIGIDLNQIYAASIQAVWTGTPAGNFTVEISNDIVAVGTGSDPAANVVNWITLSGSSTAAGGAAGNNAWLLANIGYRWVRLTYTKSGSTGSATVTWCGKGD